MFFFFNFFFNYTALQIAIIKGNKEIVEILLKSNKVDMHSDYLDSAILNGNSDIVELLLSQPNIEFSKILI